MHHSTKRHLSYANGYRELGMLDDAHDEIEKVEWDDRFLKPVLIVRLAVYTDAKKWDLVAAVARRLAADFQQESEWFIQWAYAVRRSDSLADAREVLLDALRRFPKEPCIHYNLGCYACVEGDIEEARGRVGAAIKLDRNYQKLAVEDEDLKALWDSQD
jgi:tetratricopeptide (TPR) repeat protein